MPTAVEGVENAGQAAVRPPVPIGSVFRNTPGTFADGQRTETYTDSRGNLRTILMASASVSPITSVALSNDAVGPGGLTALSFLAAMYGYDGTNLMKYRIPIVFKPFASTAITAGTGATIWTPGAGKKFRLMGWLISSSAAGQLIFGDNLAGTVIARSEAVAAAGVSKAGTADIVNGILSAVANNVLKLDGPTGNVAGMVWGVEE